MKRFFMLILAISVVSNLSGQFDEQKLIPADVDPGDFFGRYLAIEGNDIMVGAHQDDQNGYASGSVYVFEKDYEANQFVETSKILPEDGNIEEFFGYSIDISGNWAVVGSHHDSDFGGSSGSAFLLHKNQAAWSIHQKILPNDPKAGDEFGKAARISGNLIAIGSFLDDDQATNAGSVYLYNNNEGNIEFLQELYPLDAQAYDQFGNFLSLNDGLLAVGVPEKQDKGGKSGGAYIFKKNINDSWLQSIKLVPEDLLPGDEFGQAIYIKNDLLAVGAYKSDVNGENSGAVYIYKKTSSTWELVQKLVPEDNQEGDHFGNAVYLDENLLAVGAYFDDDSGSKSGSVYLYKWQNGAFDLMLKLISSDGSFGDAFGSAVALDSNYLLVGAYADSDNGFFSGSAYVYDITTLLAVEEPMPNTNIVYPSIFNQTLSIKINDQILPAAIRMYDLSGKLISNWQQNVSLQNIRVNGLNEGWYILEILTKQGRQTFRVRKTNY